MKNVSPLLALLLVLSLPAMTVVAASPSTGSETTERSVADEQISSGLIEAENTTNRLVLEGEVRSGYVQTGPDLGTALVAQDDALRTDYDLFAVENEFHDFNQSQREQAVNDAHERLEQRVEMLEQREQLAVARHANGEISDQQLVSTLVRNYNDARELSDVLGELDGYANSVSEYNRSEIEIGDTQSALAVFQSDIRAQLDATIRDEPGGAGDIVIDTTASGYSISTIDGGTYVRETTRFDNRRPDVVDFVNTLEGAENRFEEQHYPWTVETGYDRGDQIAFSRASSVKLYSTQISTAQGALEAYLDGGSENIYHEVQQLRITELPSTALEETWTNESLELSITETPVNGPIEVTVTDETGEPVDATILVDGYELEDTGADGQRWLVPPAGEFELTAQTDDGSVTATVSVGIDRTGADND